MRRFKGRNKHRGLRRDAAFPRQQPRSGRGPAGLSPERPHGRADRKGPPRHRGCSSPGPRPPYLRPAGSSGAEGGLAGYRLPPRRGGEFSVRPEEMIYSGQGCPPERPSRRSPALPAAAGEESWAPRRDAGPQFTPEPGSWNRRLCQSSRRLNGCGPGSELTAQSAYGQRERPAADSEGRAGCPLPLRPACSPPSEALALGSVHFNWISLYAIMILLNCPGRPKRPDLGQSFLKSKLQLSTSFDSSAPSWGKICHLLRNPGFLVNHFSKVRQKSHCETTDTLALRMYSWMLLLPSPCDPFLETKTYHVSTQE